MNLKNMRECDNSKIHLICMLHYNPRHVSSINVSIFRRTNCITTASGIFTLKLCKRLYSIPDESGLCRVCSMMHGRENNKMKE